MALQSKQTPGRAATTLFLRGQSAWFRRAFLWPRRSIRARLQLSHLIASLLPLLALGALLLYTSVQSERRMVGEIQLSVVRSLASDLGDSLLQFEYNVTDFGRRVPLEGTQATLDADAAEFMGQHAPDIVSISILDRAGNELAHVTPTRVYSQSELTNLANTSYFQGALQGWTQRTITDSSRGRRVLQLAVPARLRTNRIGGVVVVQISTQRMERRLSAVPATTARSAFLIDGSGQVMLGQPTVPLELRQWAGSDSVTGMLQSADGGLVSAARSPIQPSPWFVVVEQPVEVAFGIQRRNTWLLVVMLSVTVSGVVVWGLMVARRMTKPILQLRDGVQTLGSGHLGDTVAVDGEDELGELAREFNRMSQRIADSHKVIELRNARLAESQLAIEARNVRLREGLDLARLVQRDLLPHGVPADACIVAEAASEPAAEIGGDFYSYVPLPDGRLRLIVGDASGKGVAAALVMALTSSLVEIHARSASSPADLLNRINDELFPRFSANHMCVALLVAEFDPRGRQVCVANAGMISPLVAGPTTTEYVPSFGPPLGVIDKVNYVETAIELKDGQTVVFISDGIVEARNPVNAMWGFKQFEQTVERAAAGGARQIVADVLASVKHHAHDTPSADDSTIIAASLIPATRPTTPEQVAV